MVRTKGVGGCAREEGIILGCRHVGNGQETTVDPTLVICVLRVPGKKVRQGFRDWGTRVWAGVLPGRPGSPGILEIQRDPIFGPSEDDVGDASGTAVEGGRTGAVSSCSHFS